MSEQTTATETPLGHEKEQSHSCHVCGRQNQRHLVPLGKLPDDLKSIVEANAPAMVKLAQVCPSCLELFSRAKSQLDSHAKIFEQTSYVLPTPLRMGADQRFTGRGITIAFLDSGFFRHDDL